jgi:hypothetical protein
VTPLCYDSGSQASKSIQTFYLGQIEKIQVQVEEDGSLRVASPVPASSIGGHSTDSVASASIDWSPRAVL